MFLTYIGDTNVYNVWLDEATGAHVVLAGADE
jgi:hypothetical protein